MRKVTETAKVGRGMLILDIVGRPTDGLFVAEVVKTFVLPTFVLILSLTSHRFHCIILFFYSDIPNDGCIVTRLWFTRL